MISSDFTVYRRSSQHSIKNEAVVCANTRKGALFIPKILDEKQMAMAKKSS